MEDCNKLAPTNMVNHNQFWFIKMPNKTLIITKIPAIALIYLFNIVFDFLLY